MVYIYIIAAPFEVAHQFANYLRLRKHFLLAGLFPHRSTMQVQLDHLREATFILKNVLHIVFALNNQTLVGV